MSEAWVVALLIKSRHKLDAGYVSIYDQNTNPCSSAGGFGINESILCMYIDLDMLIEACDMPDLQQDTLTLMMSGYTITDIALRRACEYNSVKEQFEQAVCRIVGMNNRRWRVAHE